MGIFQKSIIYKSLKKRISVSEALVLCDKNKYEVTKQGLIYIGKKEGWIYQTKDDFHLIVNSDELIEHIIRCRDKVPWGWVLISSLAKLGKNNSEFYRVLNKSKVETRIYGREKKRYGQKKVIKKIFREHRKNNIKSKKNKQKNKI